MLIAAERGTLDFEGIRAQHQETDFALSVITASELLHGVHRAESEARRARRDAYVEALLATFPVISFDLVSARMHARLSARLSADGVSVGAHDLIIAATAMARGLDVVTRDARSFLRIPGLSLIQW